MLTNHNRITGVLYPECSLVTGCMCTDENPIIVAIDSDITVGQVDMVMQNDLIPSSRYLNIDTVQQCTITCKAISFCDPFLVLWAQSII